MQELLADEVALRTGEPGQLGDLLGDALLLLERQPDRLDDVPNSVCGSPTPGIEIRSSASSRYWTIIIA